MGQENNTNQTQNPNSQYGLIAEYKLHDDLKNSLNPDPQYNMIFETPVTGKNLPDIILTDECIEIDEYILSHNITQLKFGEKFRFHDFLHDQGGIQNIYIAVKAKQQITAGTSIDDQLNQAKNILKLNANQDKRIMTISLSKEQFIFDYAFQQIFYITTMYKHTRSLSLVIDNTNQVVILYQDGILVSFTSTGGYLELIDMELGDENMSIFDVQIYDTIPSEDDIKRLSDPENDNSYDYQDIHTNLHSYYPIYYFGNLQDKLQNSNDLIAYPLQYNIDGSLATSKLTATVSSSQNFSFTYKIDTPLVQQDYKLIFDLWYPYNSAPFSITLKLDHQYTYQDFLTITFSVNEEYVCQIGKRKYMIYIDRFLIDQGELNINTVDISQIDVQYLDNFDQQLTFNVKEVIFHKDQSLSKWEHVQIYSLPDSIIPLQNNNCQNILNDLTSIEVKVDLDITNPEGTPQYSYTIYIMEYGSNTACFTQSVTADLNTLDYNFQPDPTKNINIQVENFDSNYIPGQGIQGCVQKNPDQLECTANSMVIQDGLVVQTKNFKFSFKTFNNPPEDPQQYEKKANFDIKIYYPSQYATLRSDIQYCLDHECLNILNNYDLIPDTTIYIKLQITNTDYSQQYPIFYNVKLGETQIVPENYEELQNWNQQGYIIIAIKSDSGNHYNIIHFGLGVSQNPPSPPSSSHSSNRRLEQNLEYTGKINKIYENNIQDDYPNIGKMILLILAIISLLVVISIKIAGKYTNKDNYGIKIQKNQQIQYECEPL